MENELKLCPFCGGTPRLGETEKRSWQERMCGGDEFWHYVWCFDCCAMTDEYITEEMAIEMWNRRTGC